KLVNKPHPHIPLPRYIYDVDRLNSQGLDLTNIDTLNNLKSTMDKVDQQEWIAGPIIIGELITHGNKQPVLSPSDLNRTVGYVYSANSDDVENALMTAANGAKNWAATTVDERAACLERAADLFEKNTPTLMTLLCREGGK